MKLFEFDAHIGDWRVLVQSRDIKNGVIQSRHIADGAVTADKIGDGEVKSRNIAPEAVTTDKIGNGEVKTRNIAPGAVTNEKLVDECITGDEIEGSTVKNGKIADNAVQTRNIKDRNVTTEKLAEQSVTDSKLHKDAVTNEKIKDKQVGWSKFDDDVQNIIASMEKGGVALSKNWGDSELIGITQKKLSEAHEDLQNQINAIVNDKAEVELKVSPSTVFVGVQSTINLVATTNTSATSIKIRKGSAEIASGSGLTLSGSDTITPSAPGNTSYLSEFTIAGLQKTTSKNVVAVYPIKYGAGQAYTDATTQASVRTTPAGTYNVVVPNNGDYLFFVVPRTMNINSAKMSGFDFPLQAPQNVEIDGVEYKYYQSANTYDAGTLTIVIS